MSKTTDPIALEIAQRFIGSSFIPVTLKNFLADVRGQSKCKLRAELIQDEIFIFAGESAHHLPWLLHIDNANTVVDIVTTSVIRRGLSLARDPDEILSFPKRD